MAAQNINRVIITGNLTRDPETRALGGSGSSVTSMRVAVNGRRKNNSTQQWEDKPNYFDVTVWGAAGENAQRYLSKGRGVAIDGRLDWREWTDKEGNKRQSVEIIADNVQFLSDGQQGGGGGGQAGGYGGGERQPAYAGGGQGYGGEAPGYAGGGETRGGGGGYGQQPPAREGGYGQQPPAAPPREAYPARGGDVAVDTSDFAPAPRGGLADPGEDDIPF